MSKDFSPIRLVGNALLAAALFSCQENRPTPTPTPTPDPAAIQEKLDAKAWESLLTPSGYNQWNWSEHNGFTVPTIKINCDVPCTESEKSTLNKIFNESYKRVAERFKMDPYMETGLKKQIQVRINDGKFAFWLSINQGVAGYAYFDNADTDHEMTHIFDEILLGNIPKWWDEGHAEYISHDDNPKNDIISRMSNLLPVLKQDPSYFWEKYPCSRDAHDTGALFFAELINRGLTYENNKIAIKNIRKGNQIAPSYEAALGLHQGDLDYLMKLLSPGIRYSNYVDSCTNPPHVSH